jgi:hypothetical protein
MSRASNTQNPVFPHVFDDRLNCLLMIPIGLFQPLARASILLAGTRPHHEHDGAADGYGAARFGCVLKGEVLHGYIPHNERITPKTKHTHDGYLIPLAS